MEEAEEGDTLAVHIQRIQLNRDYAYSKQSSNFGSLTGETHIMVMGSTRPLMDAVRPH